MSSFVIGDYCKSFEGFYVEDREKACWKKFIFSGWFGWKDPESFDAFHSN